MDSDIPGILIVDDNEDNRYMLRLLLESDGHERVIDASGGKEAIALLEKEQFTLVLLDMMMPDLNGDEVLKIIQSQSGFERHAGRHDQRRHRHRESIEMYRTRRRAPAMRAPRQSSHST